MAAANRAYEALVQALRITIARLKKQRFGPSSEKIERELAQLELALESLETTHAAADPTPEADAPEAEEAPATGTAAPDDAPPQRRRGKPRIAADAPRETITLDPGDLCPDCGGALRLVGEDVAEILDFIAAKLKVVETHRPKKSCRDCERMVQTPARASPHPARHGRAGAARAHPCRQVRRPPPALPAGRDLRPHGGRHPPLHADRLVRPCRRRAAAAGRPDPRRGDGIRPHPRRRHADPGARSEEEAPRGPRARREGGPRLGLRQGRPPLGGRRSARGRLLVLPRPQGRAPLRAPRRLPRHPAGRRIHGLQGALRARPRRRGARARGGVLGASAA